MISSTRIHKSYNLALGVMSHHNKVSIRLEAG